MSDRELFNHIMKLLYDARDTNGIQPYKLIKAEYDDISNPQIDRVLDSIESKKFARMTWTKFDDSYAAIRTEGIDFVENGFKIENSSGSISHNVIVNNSPGAITATNHGRINVKPQTINIDELREHIRALEGPLLTTIAESLDEINDYLAMGQKPPSNLIDMAGKHASRFSTISSLLLQLSQMSVG